VRFFRASKQEAAAPLRERIGGRISLDELGTLSNACYERLVQFKADHPLAGADWYPYDSFGNVPRLQALLAAAGHTVAEVFGTGPVLDLCCGDGDLSVLFDSLGYEVTAVDLPSTNYNRMQGVGVLRDALAQRVDIRELDLNSSFSPPRAFYHAALFLGGLYHLKNPYLVMETLAAHCAFCVLSTRVTRLSADRKTDLSELPVAYLLGESESNHDPTNFWIFSRKGLRVMLERTHWRVRSSVYVGETEGSDPVSLDGDERGFYLLESAVWAGKLPMQRAVVEPREGWHPLEDGAWRWTAREFTIRAHRFAQPPGRIALRLVIPAPVAEQGPITLSCQVNGTPLPGATYSAAGNYLYDADLPRSVHRAREMNFAFSLDRCLAPDAVDTRERGIVVRMESLDRMIV
jgi:hypothetical protein